ncbi:hypothetical protein [Acidithiobacillus ferrooxidans]|uniref:hypothetical protein n=1 Tax=Acidithiobacillus ferrooxidans TaxID=920 RepID=UPI0011D16A3D|nr:hypothetical protein [Acidithiobacillus ferrooxidans]
MTHKYTVILTHKRETLGFVADAEDAVRAVQLANAAYPGCRMHCVHYSSIHGHYAIRSESESRGSEPQSGWWSGTFGWTDLDSSTRFNLDELRATPLPLSKGADASWKFVAGKDSDAANSVRSNHLIGRRIIPKDSWAF